MHKQIDKLALKAVNKVLKQHNCRVILAQGSKARYIVQRSTVEAKQVAILDKTQMVTGWRGAQVAKVVGYKMVDKQVWYAIGLAYGEALLDVLKDSTMQIVQRNYPGQDGWYGKGPDNRNYMPVMLDERETLQVELTLR